MSEKVAYFKMTDKMTFSTREVDKMMKRSDSIKNDIKDFFDKDTLIEKKISCGGGDINDAYTLELSRGNKVFLKTNDGRYENMFREEFRGLQALLKTASIGVPTPLSYGVDKDTGTAYILMSHIKAGSPSKTFWEDLGHGLATMHLSDVTGDVPGNTPEQPQSSGFNFGSKGEASVKYGFFHDNFIGRTLQINTWESTWTGFFRDCRLKPQIKMAAHYMDKNLLKKADALLDKLPDILEEPKQPSLIHGDLWSGNYMAGPGGKPYIYDPAAYIGHHEAELAMMELFGGPPGQFFNAYGELYPISRDYPKRRDLYNLYHLLNHLNLFGRGYLSQVASIIYRYG